MAQTTVTANFSTDNLPVPLTALVEYDKHAQVLETLIDLENDFRVFKGEVLRRMIAYRKTFSGVTNALYKDVFDRLVGDDRMGLSNDAMFQGWHSPAGLAEEHLRDALEEMLFAFWQAKSYAKAMQRNKRGAS